MKDTLSTSTTKPADFGVFNQLADYGALGLAVLGLGFVAWFLFKRNLDEQDRMKRKMEELERQNMMSEVPVKKPRTKKK